MGVFFFSFLLGDRFVKFKHVHISFGSRVLGLRHFPTYGQRQAYVVLDVAKVRPALPPAPLFVVEIYLCRVWKLRHVLFKA